LDLDPYALGVWLGLGGRQVPLEVQMHVEAGGLALKEFGAAAAAIGITHQGFIPSRFLRASAAQRQALLAGLLDVGADVDADGEILFRTESRPLAQGMYELLSTFGLSATVTGHPPQARTRKPEVWIRFSADRPVFRLTDKDLLHKERSRDAAGPHPRTITAITPIPSVPVRCIEVDNASHLFLAGRSMVPTHNSTLGLDIARSASVKNGLTSVIFSLEMSRNEIVMRLLSAEAQIPLHHMRSGKMHDPEWRKIASRQGALHEAPLFVDDSPNMTMTEIRAKCRRLKQRHDLRLVIVDYMQLMTSGKRVESRQQEVSEFSRSLKLLAKELEVPVIAISQLNRGPETRNDKKPMLSDLRESGSLEQDADMVVLIHREDAYDKDSARVGEADLIVAKHRNGPTDTVTVTFQGHYSRFVDMAPE
jgi:replicative DNA helicase